MNAGYADDLSSLKAKVKVVIAENKANNTDSDRGPKNEGRLSLVLGDMTVNSGYNFGASGKHVVTVNYDGKPISEYEVSIGNPSIATVTKRADGKFDLVVKNSGETEITVKHNNTTEYFRFNGRP